MFFWLYFWCPWLMVFPSAAPKVPSDESRGVTIVSREEEEMMVAELMADLDRLTPYWREEER